MPAKLAAGAMCYFSAPEPNAANYVCPKCGEKTLYPAAPSGIEVDWGAKAGAATVEWEVPECRRAVAKIRGISVELDESELCARCSPDVTDRRLSLVVRHPEGEEPHRVFGVDSEDVKLLVEFSLGNVTYDAGMDGEKPLTDRLSRLESLLGVEAAKED